MHNLVFKQFYHQYTKNIHISGYCGLEGRDDIYDLSKKELINNGNSF